MTKDECWNLLNSATTKEELQNAATKILNSEIVATIDETDRLSDTCYGIVECDLPNMHAKTIHWHEGRASAKYINSRCE